MRNRVLVVPWSMAPTNWAWEEDDMAAFSLRGSDLKDSSIQKTEMGRDVKEDVKEEVK
jgi:hypothetical protein